MEAKEICFRVLEKFNDKDVLKEYKASLNKGAGFSINRVAPITYPITDGEAIETEYLFHSIEKKLEDIACDELLKLL